MRKPSFEGVKKCLTIIVLGMFVFIGGVLIFALLSNADKPAITQRIDSIPAGDLIINRDKYHAVFLNNNQVYFAKIIAYKTTYVLTDIFYIKESTEGGQLTIDTLSDNPQIDLVKLGEELHGPKDEMIVPTNSIVFFEELKDEGKVVKAIQDYYK